MNVLLFMSVFWILYGIAGLLGFQNIPAKYKEHSWTKDVGRILRTFKIKKNVEVTDNGKIII